MCLGLLALLCLGLLVLLLCLGLTLLALVLRFLPPLQRLLPGRLGLLLAALLACLGAGTGLAGLSLLCGGATGGGFIAALLHAGAGCAGLSLIHI